MSERTEPTTMAGLYLLEECECRCDRCMDDPECDVHWSDRPTLEAVLAIEDEARAAAESQREALRAAIEQVLTDVPQLDGVWSTGDRTWYLEGWSRCARDVRAAIKEGAIRAEAAADWERAALKEQPR